MTMEFSEQLAELRVYLDWWQDQKPKPLSPSGTGYHLPAEQEVFLDKAIGWADANGIDAAPLQSFLSQPRSELCEAVLNCLERIARRLENGTPPAPVVPIVVNVPAPIVNVTMPACQREPEQTGDAGWVLISELQWPKGREYATDRKRKAFLKAHKEIRTNKPSSQRFEVSSKDFTRYWAKTNKAAFDGNLESQQPITPGTGAISPTTFVGVAKETYDAIRAKKSGGK